MTVSETPGRTFRHVCARLIVLIEAYLIVSVVAVYVVFFVFLDSPPYPYSRSDLTWLYHAPLSGVMVIVLVLSLGVVRLPWSFLFLLALLPPLASAYAYMKDTRGEWPLFLMVYTLSWLFMCGIGAVLYASATVS